MASQLFSTFTEVGLVDTRVNAGTIQLPKTIDIPYRQISLKDIYGNFQNKSLTLTTQFPDTFEDGTTTKVLSNAFGFTTLYAGPTNVWYMTGGTTLTSQTISSLTVSSISGSGALLANLPAISSLSLQCIDEPVDIDCCFSNLWLSDCGICLNCDDSLDNPGTPICLPDGRICVVSKSSKPCINELSEYEFDINNPGSPICLPDCGICLNCDDSLNNPGSPICLPDSWICLFT